MILETLPIASPFLEACCCLVQSIDSTQSLARRLAREGSFPAGSLVAAEEQSAGRGRFPGRAWESEPGKNLLFTIRLDPGAATLAGLPIRIGCALASAVGAYAKKRNTRLPEAPRLKWPNDLMLADRKAGGILCEAGPEGVFAGIGLNCNQTLFPPDLEGGATSLVRELGLLVERWELLELFLEELARSLRDDQWRSRAQALLWRRGESDTFLPGLEGSAFSKAAQGLSGTIEGIDELGSLLFRVGGASHAQSFAAGELRADRLPGGKSR